ncbi:MAG: redox-sensitive transcriptional activator SoxR [Chloroflexi bacterium]|nr:redox-sensitive transcriptional activator SoxR [Chloroflexota bacterium]
MPATSQWLTIGELAERSGVSRSAIRFYESRGLIASRRSEGNHRLFARGTLRVVSVIRAAQAVGLSLDLIGDTLAGLPSGRMPTQWDWARFSERWRRDLDDRIAGLQHLRDDLSGCIGCGCLSLEVCPVLNRDDAARALGAGPRYLLGDTPADAADGTA